MSKFVKESLSFIKKTILAFLLLIFTLVIVATLGHFNMGVGIFVGIQVIIVWALILAFFWYRRRQTVKLGKTKATFTKSTITILIIACFLLSSMLFGLIRFYRPEKVIVGATYYIGEDDLDRLVNTGITSVRIMYEPISYPTNDKLGDERYYTLLKFFKRAQELGIEIVLQTPVYSSPEFERYVSEFGKFIDYYQLANELDTVHILAGAPYPFMETEIITILENLKSSISKYDYNFKTIATWSVSFEARADLITFGGLSRICEHVDIVGYDTYQKEGAMLLPYAINLLRSLTKKPVWITEVGMSTTNQQAQADYIIQTLDFAKKNNIERVYIFTWNIDWNEYAIKGKLAEQKVKEWVEKNA